jgi:Xaa-Pro aminopeptidase
MIGRGSVAILPAAPERTRNRDVEYPYRQDSDFYYLCGFPEPEAVAVFTPGRKHGEYTLFCRERDPDKETWHGRRAGLDGAIEAYGADDAFPITDIDEILPGLIEGTDRVYYGMGLNAEFDQRLMGWINQIREHSRGGAHAPGEFVALDHVLHEMRLFKSRGEIAQMRRAARISVQAHIRAMQSCQPGMWEYQLEAEILHTFHQHGARSPAYPSIVGGGENGCVLHYIDNCDQLKDGDLVLIDAGAELDHYASDITRTFPVNGRFTSAQADLYEVVLEAQKDAFAQVKAGNHWDDPHMAAVKAITRGLLRLGLLKGTVAKLIKEEAYRRFYMHRTGHWLGMDVHDVGEYKIDDQWRLLEPGMVLTIEPGLYIPGDSRGVAKRWRGIGIRIEDDVVVTQKGPDILTAKAPKEIAEIEALMARGAG